MTPERGPRQGCRTHPGSGRLAPAGCYPRPALSTILCEPAEVPAHGRGIQAGRGINRSGERFSVRGVALLVNRYLRRVGVTDHSGPHLLRHTFATHALRARPDLRAVQELLGLSGVTTTQRYTHMSAEDLQAQVAELPGSRLP